MAAWIDVASENEIKPGEWIVVKSGLFDIIIFNLEGEFYAIEDVCPHDGEELSSGELEGDEIVCPRHGAQFNIKTGEVTVPPALEGVATFPTRVCGGKVQVKV